MEKVEFASENEMPFCRLSKEFPELRFYRWCNSAVDYLEFYGKGKELERLISVLPSVEGKLGSKIVYLNRERGALTVMFSCRCTVENSTISMAEEAGCIWEAPLVYNGGQEIINVTSVHGDYTNRMFKMLRAAGKARILRKTTVVAGMLRQSFLIRLSEVFRGMTPIQLRALQIAVRSGYFSIPRRGRLADIAVTLHVSKSTAEEHLNKARSKLMSSLEPYIDMYASSLRDEDQED
ncbi:MAG: helix-turn-helix domain-containing protein [Thermoplasmata archaeon]